MSQVISEERDELVTFAYFNTSALSRKIRRTEVEGPRDTERE